MEPRKSDQKVDSLLKEESVTENFYRLFNRTEFYGEADFQKYSELADEWWKINNEESEADFFYMGRPRLGGIVYV